MCYTTESYEDDVSVLRQINPNIIALDEKRSKPSGAPTIHSSTSMSSRPGTDTSSSRREITASCRCT